jgi:iron complex outermembrane receptor protein
MMPVLLLFLCAAGVDSNEPPRTQRDTIVVTGTYEPVPLEEADRSVGVINVSSLQLLSNSVADHLRLDPSLDLRQRAPNAVQSDLSIRGGTFGQTLVLLDGVRLNDAQSGHHNMDVPVPLESVSRIEVLRGSGSTLYGSDAVGGVVHIITARPETNALRLRAAAGSFGINQQSASLALVGKRADQQFFFSRDFSSGFLPNRDYRNLSLASHTYFKSSLGATAFLLSHNDRPFGAEGFYGNFPSWERTKTWFASVHQELGAKTEASFAFRRHTDLFVLYRDRPEVFTNRHAVEGFQATVRRRDELTPNGRVHYGAEGHRDSIESTNLGTHARGRGAGYAAIDFRALRRYSLTAGAREELYGSGNSQFSPSASLGAWLSDRLKLRASVSRAFRLPTFTDLYYHDPANRGSPDLRPERAWSYEAGAGWRAGRRLSADVSIFHRRETDGLDYVRRAPGDIWRAANIQRLRFTGVEASAGIEAGGSQRIDVRYTGLRGARAALEGLASRYVFNYPSHAAVAAWQGRLGREVVGRARLGVTQRRARAPYAVLDVFAARGRGRLRPFLQFTNLSGTSYEEILGVRMPGRAIVGGLELTVVGLPR